MGNHHKLENPQHPQLYQTEYCYSPKLQKDSPLGLCLRLNHPIEQTGAECIVEVALTEEINDLSMMCLQNNKLLR